MIVNKPMPKRWVLFALLGLFIGPMVLTWGLFRAQDSWHLGSIDLSVFKA